MTSQKTTQTLPRATTVTYDVDPSHSVVEFSVKHLMVTTVTGRFRTYAGAIEIDEADLALARVSGEIDVASVDTSAPDRDAHLRSPDFFDAANHPKIAFRSTRVERTGEDTARVTGDLTIRGVTRQVTLDAALEGRARDPWGNDRIGLTATGAINRKDFGLNWNVALEAGGVLVSDKVKLTLHVSAVARKQG